MKWRLHDIEVLRELGQLWDSINGAGANLPILDSAFFQALLTETGAGEAKLALCEDATGPVAATILTRKSFGVWAMFRFLCKASL